MQTELLKNSAIIEALQNGFAEHTRTHAELLAKDYLIENPKEVANFIGENLFLLKLLEEIPNKISHYFGNEQNLVLKASFEPEFPNSSELWVEILTKLPAEEAAQLLDKFDEDWWLENMERANYKLNVTLVFN